MMSLKFRNRVVRAIVGAIFVSTTLTLSHPSSAAPITWQGTGADQNWSTPGNWIGNVPPGTADDVKFTDLGGNGVIGQVDNIIDSTRTNLSLQFASTNTVFHTTQINPGVALVLTGSGGLITGNEIQSDTRVTHTITGTDGTLIISNTAANINVRQPAGVATANRLTLDMSGLDTFQATVARLMVGVAGGGTINRATGRLLLARTNVIATSGAAPQTDISDSVGSSNNGLGSTLSLGQTNSLFTDTISVGRGRESAGTLNFNAAFSSPGVFIRGTNGLSSRVSSWTIGDAATQTGTITARGTVTLTAGTLDAMIDNLILGQPSLGTGDGSQSQGTFSMGVGTLNVNTLILGNTRTNNLTSANATFNLNAGSTLIVNSNLVLTRTSGGGAGITNTATLNATSALIAANSITNAGNGTNRINLTTSTLIVTNTAGTAAQPIGLFTIADSTLQLNAVAGQPAIVANTLTVNGSSDIINISSAPGVGQFPLITYTALGNASPDFTLGTLPAIFQGYISNNITANSVDLVIISSTIKTDTWRGNVNGDWDTTTLNWFANGSASAYAQTDPVVFDDTLTGTPNVNLTLVLTPPSVTVNNSSANYTFTGSGKLSGSTGIIKSGDHSLTLSETGGDDFAGGVTVNGGTVVLDDANSAISGAFFLGSGTTLQIGNNDANGNLPSGGGVNNGSLIINRSDIVLVNSPISGAGTLVKIGNGTLTLSNANTYTGDTAILKGTLALAGSTTLSNSANVIVSNAAVDLSGLRTASTINNLVLSDSTLTFGSTNLAAPLNVTTLTVGGSANTLNLTALPTFAAYPATITLVQSVNGISGAPLPATGSLPNGFVGNAHLSQDGLAIQLTLTSGPTGTRPNVSWSGADVANLNTNWSDAQNWQLPGAPVAGDNVLFNNNGAVSSPAISTPGSGLANFTPDFINNIVDDNFTLSSLTYTNLANFYHNTFIKSGKVLSVTNTFNIGALDTGTSAQTTTVAIAGTNATLSFNNTNGNMQVWLGSPNGVGVNRMTLDLSALDNFNASASRILVGANINQIVNRASGILYLAKTNNLTATFQTTTDSGTATGNSAITVGDANSNAGAESSLVLGLANTISADTINIGRQKATGHLNFNPIYANIAPYPSVTFQGFSGSPVGLFEVGNSAGNSGGTTLTADATLTGGIVTANIGTLNVGRAAAAAGTGNTTGIFNFDAGTVNANIVNIGLQPLTGTKVGIGIFGVSSNTIIGASANLVAGTINLGLAGGDTGATSTSGTLNITNGTVTANSIVAGTNSVSVINILGGRLSVTGTIGSASAPLGTLTLAPLNTPDNSNTVVTLSASPTPSAVVNTLAYDGLDTTTNKISISSVANITAPVELPLIKYTSLTPLVGGTFNIGLGTLPPGYTGYLTNDTTLGAIALVVTSAPVITTPPTINKISIVGGNIVITGNNNTGTASTYHLLSSTNLALPLANWTVVTNGSFDNTGALNVTNAIDPTKPRGFYILQVP